MNDHDPKFNMYQPIQLLTLQPKTQPGTLIPKLQNRP